MKIRAYQESDEKDVVKLWQEAFPDSPAWNDPVLDIKRKLAVQRELFLVAEIESNIVGTAMAGFDGHRGWVYYVAVRRQYRRHGIGKALMRSAEEKLALIGCPKLNLQVRSTNHEVIAFYKELGYNVEERISLSKRLSNQSDNIQEYEKG
ncbi:MAG: GNAT family acetyltransferase [candidate division Zixibacteria bacterium]|nr:GNAT family acetyltransferase [candidate division Zixibacteria bacterium]